MIKIPSMLMVGAGDRNAGKTEFVCSLIKKFGSDRKITAIKVTTVHERDGVCPRGGEGCGACSAMNGNFCIIEETNSRSNKDTGRMLAAGAARVFWLRVLKAHYQEGVTALLSEIGQDSIQVCESNSLRTVVEPGLFFIVGKRNGGGYKPSAQDVLGYADDILFWDGNTWDIDIHTIELVDNRWVLRMDATAIIMAGGKSRRMGLDKSLLPVDGKPLIQYMYERLHPYFREVLISSDDASKYAFLGVKIIPDEVAGKGPLTGIASALRVSANQTNFVIACDIPDIRIRFIQRMLRESDGFDAVVPQTGPAQYEPLYAVYHKSALAAIDKAITSEIYRIVEPFKECTVKYIDMAHEGPLVNLNTMDKYLEYVGKKENAAI